jgi:exodeoxyribonuclease V alpha subunit
VRRDSRLSNQYHTGRQASFNQAIRNEDAEAVDCVQGVVERIVYESDDTGFLVARMEREDTGELITFVGAFVAVSAGDTMRLWGQWQDNPKFGRQLRVDRFETILPTTVTGIEKYLGSGLIDGIGKEFAKRIVKAFGVETLRVIDEEPERLREVKGIGKKRAVQIREAWEAQRAVQSIMIFLQGHGIGVGQAVRIYKRYGDSAITVLRQNPYRLAADITGIAFKTADAIAQELGVPKDSPQRARAGLKYVLEQAMGHGHVFLPWEVLRSQARDLLEVDPAILDAAQQAAEAVQDVVREGESVYLPALYAAETGASARLKRLISAPSDKVPIKIEKAIEWVERTKAIELSEEQRQAIRTAVAAKVMVITGGPGTGKTTLLNGLLDIFAMKGLDILLAAPTGRAAKRMEAATGRAAKTIHRLLEFSPKNGGFTRDETNPLTADLVVIDEASMVDINLMHSLLKAVPASARLFVVGDVDQLPSVGPGNVLMDLISSQAMPVVWLKTVFRQAAQSGIVANAHRVNQGQYPEFNTTDFFMVERKDPAKALETVLEIVTNRIPKKFGLDPKRDVQVLAPMHRGDVGVKALNEGLQRALNPEVQPLGRRLFGQGDKVMQQRNNYELDVFNGDVGVITEVHEDIKEVQVQFEDRAVIYPFDALDELGLAYASTVHKAQGSEYPAVVIPLMTQHYMMLQRNVFYTGLTRASRIVIIVGDPKAVGIAIRNTKVTRRNTRLSERLANRA